MSAVEVSNSLTRPLRIAISAHGTNGFASGLGQYLAELLKHWLRQAPQHSYHVFAHTDDIDAFDPDHHDSVTRHTGSLLHRGMLDWAWHQTVFPMWTKLLGCDCAFIAVDRRSPLWNTVPTACGVHDFTAFHLGNRYGGLRTWFNTRLVTKGIRRAQHVVCISDHTRSELDRYVGALTQPVTTIPNGVDYERFADPQPQRISRTLEAFAITKPYLFFPGRLEHPGKNHVAAIKALQILRQKFGKDISLVCAGKPWAGVEHIHSCIKDLNLEDQVQLVGFVDNDQLTDLYHGAEALIFPSRFEGFGLPLLEAMAAGLPVISSSASGMEQIVGDAGVCCDPADADAMAAAALQILDDKKFRQDLVNKGFSRAQQFSWQESATQHLKVLVGMTC